MGDARLAEVALALNPLVPGISVARELLSEYRRLHGPDLAARAYWKATWDEG